MIQSTYKLLQIKLEREDYDIINDLGREKAYAENPKFEASESMMLAGPEAFIPEWAQYYDVVAEISVDYQGSEYDRMEKAFYTHNNPRGLQECEDRITRYGVQHSMSVGDILVTEQGRVFMVDRSGFVQMTNVEGMSELDLGLERKEAS